jgi:hypothetical protein
MSSRASLLLTTGLLTGFCVFLAAPAAAQNVAVTAANPATGEQDTLSLVVKITGRNFAPGAQSQFLKSGSNDPSGITVRGTQFVSASEVDATIDIAASASLSFFDVRVTNTNGRSGKGSDLFKVVEKQAACSTAPLDASKFQLVGTLNHLTGAGTPEYGPNLGVSTSLVPATLALPDGSNRTVLIAAVGTPRATATFDVFVLDAAAGAVLDGQPLCPTCSPQVHIQMPIPNAAGSQRRDAGDVNGDGIPDFAVLDAFQGLGTVFVGALSSSGQLQYTAVPLPIAASNCCSDIAIGDLDGVAGDEIAVGNIGGGKKNAITPAAVYLFKIAGATATRYQTLIPTATPATGTNDFYAAALAVGDVTNDGRPDLTVGAPQRLVAGANQAGAVFVHAGAGAAPPYSLSTTPLILVSSSPASGDGLGQRVAIGNVNGTGTVDVVALTRDAAARGEVLPGHVVNGEVSDPQWTFSGQPGSGVSDWSGNKPAIGDLNGDGLLDIVVGSPLISAASQCPAQGMVFVFFAKPDGGWNRSTIQTSVESDTANFGYSVSVANGYPFLLVGDHLRNLGSSAGAGQAFLYRVLP